MALTINEDCINCAACVEECPNQAISETPEIYVIDPEKCTECVGYFDEPQCIPSCGVDAIVPDPDYQETKDELLAKKERLAHQS